MTFQLPVLQGRPSSPTLQELSEKLQKKIDSYRSYNKNPPRLPTMAAVPETPHYTSRTLSEPISAVEICPAYPDYMIIGTYALLKVKSDGQVRTGSISVVSLETAFKPAYPGQVAPFLDEKCLDAAVLDIHFHPSDDTLLGVATSDAKVTFFRLRKCADVLARKVEMQLLHLGSIEVGEPNEHGEIPLITSFCWMPGFAEREGTGRAEVEDYHTLSLAASISNGDVRWVRTNIPATSTAKDAGPTFDLTGITTVSMERHTEEAWTVAATTWNTIYHNQLGDVKWILVLSGGDDSALIANSGSLTSETIEQAAFARIANTAPSSGEGVSNPDPTQRSTSLFEFTSHHLWTDRKSHTAGVVAILPLPFAPSHEAIIPVLTGSYDEHIRLFSIDASTRFLKRSLVLEKKLNGGVWRLKLMHSSWPRPITPPSSSSAYEDNKSKNRTYSALILASCMHAGVRILRLTYNPPPPPTTSSSASTPDDTQRWAMTVLAKFTKGHESMNYASDFRTELDQNGRCTGEYTIVSTSFYDKAVCVWKFVDEEGQ